MSFKYLLSPYIKTPEKYPNQVVFSDSKVVIIRDLYPKSILHYLVLTRSPQKTKQSPLMVFKDNDFKLEMMTYVQVAKDKLIEEFNEHYKSSTIEIEKFIMVGCHAVPSLANLHIHVLTKDFHSKSLKNKKHYNSFNTEFFIPLKELPLPNKTKFEEKRYDSVLMEKICKTADMKCRYCDENFSNKFLQLKLHIDEEFAKNFTTI